MSLIERLTAVFAPDSCLACGREGSLLCRGCLAELPPPRGICFGCKQPVAGASCQRCLTGCGLDALYVAADYSGVAKSLVVELKFVGNQSAAKIMSNALSQKLPELGPAVVANVPATVSHIRQRGYDQAALMGRQLGRARGLPSPALLHRLGTNHQLGANREQRSAQLAGLIFVHPHKAMPRRTILLCDDVLTTGASMQAAAQALRAAGANKIIGLAFAQSIHC